MRDGWRGIEPDGADIVARSVIVAEAVGHATKCYERVLVGVARLGNTYAGTRV